MLVLLLPGSSRASLGLSRVHLRRHIKQSCGLNTFSKSSGGATIIKYHQWIIHSITKPYSMEDTTSIKSGSTTATNGTKRKRSSEPKFYAVRSGHKPGVYYTWADCLEQVKGFKKAMCESAPRVGTSACSIKKKYLRRNLTTSFSQILSLINRRRTIRCRRGTQRRLVTGIKILRGQKWANPRHLYGLAGCTGSDHRLAEAQTPVLLHSGRSTEIPGR